MSVRAIALVVALPLLYSPTAPAQTSEQRLDGILARLSYQTTYGVDWREQKHSPGICFAIYRSGYYLISRINEYGSERLQGTLTKHERVRVRTMLKNLNSETDRVAVTSQGSESLRLEIVRGGATSQLVWIDPDHNRPLPDSAMKIVDWLQNFSQLDASPVTQREVSEKPICPQGSVKPLQPVNVVQWK
jgi:hypothetical protein